MVVTRSLVVLILASLMVSGAGYAQENQWKIVEENGKKIARVANAEGHTLEIYRATQGKPDVWLRFELDPKSLDALANRVPVFRIDEGEAVDLDSMSKTALAPNFLSIGSRQFSLIVFFDGTRVLPLTGIR